MAKFTTAKDDDYRKAYSKVKFTFKKKDETDKINENPGMLSIPPTTMVPTITEQGHNYVVVTALDIGTTFSGYAFSFKNKTSDIIMNKNWGENMGKASYKTPTVILLEDDKFIAFGYDAEQKYADSVANNRYSLFKRFKMRLHKQETISKDISVTATNGNTTNAGDIFVMTLIYLKEHFLAAVNKAYNTPLDINQIKWVITVPAIWSDVSKKFMRSCAFQAGLTGAVESDQLVIALEPEVASVHCRTLPVAQFQDHENATMVAGDKYMIIDAGGGTVDIAIHEVLENMTVRELHYATGGACGGSQVDITFGSLLSNLLEDNFVNHFREKYPIHWLNLMLDFEMKKRSYQPGSGSTKISINAFMVTEFKQLTSKDLQEVINNRRYEGVNYNNGFLCLSADVMGQLFEEVFTDIQNCVQNLLEKPDLMSIKYIYLVGGFSECKALQENTKTNFGSKRKILVPLDASLSVLKGAVLFGHNPLSISSRQSRRTYAIRISRPYNSATDKDRKLIDHSSGTPFVHHLSPLVTLGENVRVGTIKENNFIPLETTSTMISVPLYTSVNKSVGDPLDSGNHEIATITVKSPDTSKPNRQVIAQLTFGGTEITLKAIDKESGHQMETKVDYMIG